MINEIDGCMYIIKTKPKHDKKLGDDKKQPHSLGKKEKKKRTLGIMRYGEEKRRVTCGWLVIDLQIYRQIVVTESGVEQSRGGCSGVEALQVPYDDDL